MSPQNNILYTLPHGIEVLSVYAPCSNNRYWSLRIKAHPFFTNKVINGACQVQRNRVVMVSVLGRGLDTKEHVHHINGDREDDRPENLTVMMIADHSRIHRKGRRGHSPSIETRQKISASVKRAIKEGRLTIPRYNLCRTSR